MKKKTNKLAEASLEDELPLEEPEEEIFDEPKVEEVEEEEEEKDSNEELLNAIEERFGRVENAITINQKWIRALHTKAKESKELGDRVTQLESNFSALLDIKK